MIRTRPKSRPALKGKAFDPTIFDVFHFRHYTQGNPKLEAELIGLFHSQLPALVDQLGDWESADDWNLAVHTLKGSARAIGAVAIGDIAVILEERGLSGGTDMRKSLLRALQKAIADFAAETKKLTS